MTLSGYLFAKLLDGKTIEYRDFLWNRFLRLFPLLAIVVLIVGISRIFVVGENPVSYVYNILRGAVYPTLPNGGWSITVEFHYYLILPVFLWMLTKSKLLPLSIVAAAIAVRSVLHYQNGEIQSLAFWTIVGRIDQFALGMLFFQFRSHFARRHVLAFSILAAFTLFYWYFDYQGGFYQSPSYPSPSRLWIFLPTIEGIAYAAGIAWYESSFTFSATGVFRLIGRMGEYSYSIYLLHFFFVFHAARFVNQRVMDLSNFYIACVWSAVFFLCMIPLGYLSFRFVEGPFLKLRRRYITTPSIGQKVPD